MSSHNFTEPIEYKELDLYWDDDTLYAASINDDFCENEFYGPDEDEDYPFDDEDYENFMDLDQQ
jgi:hypothetical protein